jgi:hypothetical protein
MCPLLWWVDLEAAIRSVHDRAPSGKALSDPGRDGQAPLGVDAVAVSSNEHCLAFPPLSPTLTHREPQVSTAPMGSQEIFPKGWGRLAVRPGQPQHVVLAAA